MPFDPLNDMMRQMAGAALRPVHRPVTWARIAIVDMQRQADGVWHASKTHPNAILIDDPWPEYVGARGTTK